MTRLFVTAVIALTLLSAAACGGGGAKPLTSEEVTALYDVLPIYAGASLAREHTRPIGYVGGTQDEFENDKLYFIQTAEIEKQPVVDFYTTKLTELGWTIEDPAAPRGKGYREYCGSQQIVTCVSATKDDVRLIVSFPFLVGLNPVGPQGLAFQLHVERA